MATARAESPGALPPLLRRSNATPLLNARSDMVPRHSEARAKSSRLDSRSRNTAAISAPRSAAVRGCQPTPGAQSSTYCRRSPPFEYGLVARRSGRTAALPPAMRGRGPAHERSVQPSFVSPVRPVDVRPRMLPGVRWPMAPDRRRCPATCTPLRDRGQLRRHHARTSTRCATRGWTGRLSLLPRTTSWLLPHPCDQHSNGTTRLRSQRRTGRPFARLPETAAGPCGRPGRLHRAMTNTRRRDGTWRRHPPDQRRGATRESRHVFQFPATH